MMFVFLRLQFDENLLLLWLMQFPRHVQLQLRRQLANLMLFLQFEIASLQNLHLAILDLAPVIGTDPTAEGLTDLPQNGPSDRLLSCRNRNSICRL